MITHLLYLTLIAILCAANLWLCRHNERLEEQISALHYRQLALLEIMKKWERTFLDAASIVTWANTGRIEERNWWE